MRLNRRSAAVLAVLIAGSLAPAVAPAAPGDVVTNPFGNLTLQVLTQPSGTTPGTARATIVTSNGAVTSSGATAYFGLRLMGGEDIQMTGFSLVGGNDSSCIVSDFAGAGTPGWQGGPVFGAEAPGGIGSGNSHMRMIGGYIRKQCGDIRINLTFTTRPLVLFYGAFYGLEPAPWHENYGAAPWSTIPTGGDARYQKWWNLWGTFDTLGYSNACTSVSGSEVSCG